MRTADVPHGPWWRLVALVTLLAILAGVAACWDRVTDLRRSYLGSGLRSR